MHNVDFNIKTILSSVVLIFGATLTIITAPKGEELNDVQSIYDFYFSASSIIYILLVIIFLIILYKTTQKLDYIEDNPQLYGHKLKLLHRSLYPIMSGVIGSFNLLFGKSISKLLLFTFENKHYLNLIYILMFVLGVVIATYFHIKWLNSGLKRFESLHVYPIKKASWIIFSILGGLIVYKEHEEFENKDDDTEIYRVILFTLGMVTIFFGILFLSLLKMEMVISEEDIDLERGKNIIPEQIGDHIKMNSEENIQVD